jgi:hypothetical protein
MVEFGELGVRGALGFSLLTCTFDTRDIVKEFAKFFLLFLLDVLLLFIFLLFSFLVVVVLLFFVT